MKNFIYLISIIAIYSCGTPIHQSTVQLSADVGSRITEMESLHQLAIQRYFDIEIQKIEDFLTNTWEPLFLKNFLGTSQILDELEHASRIDAASRNQLQSAFKSYLIDTSEAVQAVDDLVDELNKSRSNEGLLVKSIVTKYVFDSIRINEAVVHITSLLGSDDPALIILDFAEAAHYEMNARRTSLLAPIEQARNEIQAELGEAYAQLIHGQATITGRLEAAAQVSEARESMFANLGLSKFTDGIQNKLSNITTEVDGALSVVNNLSSETSGIDLSDPSSIINKLQQELQDINNQKN